MRATLRNHAMTQGQLFVLQGLLIVVVPYAVWRFSACRRLAPLVVVQISAGIVLGPSVLGRISPDLYVLLFSPASLERLSGIASIGVLIFGFVTGLHINIRPLVDRPLVFLIVAVTGMVVPLGLGIVTGTFIVSKFPAEIGSGSSPSLFALAIGVSCAVTALPVLSAIVQEVHLVHTRLGQWSLAIAAVTDAVLWLILAVLLGASAGREGPHLVILEVIALFLLYVVVLIFIVKPALRRVLQVDSFNNGLVDGTLVLLLAIVFASSLVTEMIGLHYILGAFLAGVVVPLKCREEILEKFAPAIALLMPFFFMITGLKTSVDFGSGSFLIIFSLATISAIAGRVIGTAVPLKFLGWSWTEATALGALLQTKGLMEVVVLSILLDAHVITQTVFSALVLMAVCSTALAIPLMKVALRRSQHSLSDPGTANKAAG